jgi:primosomal protein N' (replication factor Y)
MPEAIPNKYIDVIVPLPLANTFTYSVPVEFEDKIQLGMRVVVSFGVKKIYTGVVYTVHLTTPQTEFDIKPILDVLDEKPILLRSQLRFWEWISAYYQCTLGEVYKAALPSGLKLESETKVSLSDDFNSEIFLTEKEQRLVDALSQKKFCSISELQSELKVKNILPLLKTLIEKELIIISEELKESYKPKLETYIKLSEEYTTESGLQALFNTLGKQKKQLDLLMTFLDLSKVLVPNIPKSEVPKKSLLEKSDISQNVLNTLIKKGIFETYNKEIGRLDTYEKEKNEAFPLNIFQQKALEEIYNSFSQKNVTLLHGVTSSGKTEIYIHIIQKVLDLGKQVLYLVPEIALTAQITTRLKRVFGNQLGIYHSKFSDNERVEIWNNLLHNKTYKVILGVRSSVFLPFSNLGLIIVDEEHENTYKQFDPAPRYHARNSAVVLASMHGAKTLLGTATPALETFHNIQTGKYGYVELTQRHAEIELPQIIPVDTKELRRKKLMKSNYSPILIEEITKALEQKEQVILFQNRRGFAPYIECPSCAWVPKCKNCDVSLTYHKAFNLLSCHYCGNTYPIPTVCPACGNPKLEMKGFGTERIETDIEELFPDARIMRMDLDSTRSKNAYEKIINDFEEHKIDILVGTQMISKGLDFERVSVVGVLNADNLLNFPDFRAHERAFQLLTQVSGRAGRKNKRGLVIIQTSEPNHPVIKQVMENDYRAMSALQLQERKIFNYPPYFRLMYLFVKHRDVSILNKATRILGEELRQTLGSGRVLGPETPAVSRIKNLHIKKFMIKIEMQASNEKAKQIVRTAIEKLQSEEVFRALVVNFDVDPM